MINTIEHIQANFSRNGLVSETANKINELVDTINRHEVQIVNLRGGYTDAEIKKQAFKPWPQIEDTIFFIDMNGIVCEGVWWEANWQRKCRDFLGIYRTREEAEGIVKFTMDSMSQGGMR